MRSSPTTANNLARYQAVILASGDLGHNVANPDGTTSFLSALADTEWAALAKFERTFGIRRLSDYTAPAPAHGLAVVGGATQDGVAATLTAAGRQAFPYLRGPVTIADDDAAVAETFGYPATPAAGADWQTLLATPNGSALLGIYTHPDDGREEMVMTVASNQFQNHNQLLRHGMLNWVTRGVFLGYQRSYLELHVDDLFLGRRRLGPGDAQHELRPGAREPHDARGRRPRDRLVARSRTAARHGLQRRRERALRAGIRDGGPARRRSSPTRPYATRSATSTTRSSIRTSTARRARSSRAR